MPWFLQTTALLLGPCAFSGAQRYVALDSWKFFNPRAELVGNLFFVVISLICRIIPITFPESCMESNFICPIGPFYKCFRGYNSCSAITEQLVCRTHRLPQDFENIGGVKL